MLRHKLLIATAAVAVAALSAGSSLAFTPASHSHAMHYHDGSVVLTAAHPSLAAANPVPDTSAIIKAEAALLHHKLPPQPGNSVFAGYGVTAVVGKNIVQVTTTFTVPTVLCSDTVVGTSGHAYITPWDGLEASNSTLPQTGLYAWCTGPAGHLATSGPFYTAWYYICCSQTVPLVNYPGQPTLHAGDSLTFETSLNTGTGQYTFTFTDHATNQVFSATVGCPSDLTCPTPQTAFTVSEAPGGGPPAFPLPHWAYADCLNCNPKLYTVDFSGTSIVSSDGSQGTLNSLAGEWNNGNLVMSFPGISTPYFIAGYLNGFTWKQGFPGPLSTDGKSFTTGCIKIVDSTPSDDQFCTV